MKKLNMVVAVVSLFYVTQSFAASYTTQPPIVEVELVQETFTAVRVGGTINVDMQKQFETVLASLPGETHILLNLNSHGGSNMSGEYMLKLMDEYAQKGYTFSTTVENGSFCLSMCIPLYMMGKNRYAGERSLFMFHAATPWYTNMPDPISTKVYLDLLLKLGVSEVWLQGLIDQKVFSEPSEYWVTGEELLTENSNIVTKAFSKVVKPSVWMAQGSPDIKPR